MLLYMRDKKNISKINEKKKKKTCWKKSFKENIITVTAKNV